MKTAPALSIATHLGVLDVVALLYSNGSLILYNGALALDDAVHDLCDCVCGPAYDCDDPDTVRQGDWQVTISGISGTGCDGSPAGQRCSDMNGTYTFTGPPAGSPSEYTNTTDKDVCGLYDWRLFSERDCDGGNDYCYYELSDDGLNLARYAGSGFPNETIRLYQCSGIDPGGGCDHTSFPAYVDLVPV